jgi:hypothetical protein
MDQMNQMNDQLMSFKFPLHILSWNVRGLGDTQKCDVIKDSQRCKSRSFDIPKDKVERMFNFSSKTSMSLEI